MMEVYLDEVSNEDFEKYFKFVENLAAGAFGKVIRAVDLKTNEEVAIKVIDKDIYSKRISSIKQEINIIQQLCHKNIVHFLGFIDAKYKLYIVMKLLRGGTIKSLLEKRNKSDCSKLTEYECSIIMKNLFEAVKCLHEREIIHRDIKPENVMLENVDDLNSLKLIDFGLSAQHYENIFLYDLCGTLIYMAPEQLEKRAYSKPIDMWSCGMVMYYILNKGMHPIYQKGMSSKIFISKLKDFHCEYKCEISTMAKSLLHKLLEVNPSRRYTVDKALNHPWITREKFNNIPVTYFEAWRIASFKRKFKQAFGVVLFMIHFNKKSNKEKVSFIFNKCKDINFIKYTLLVNKISKSQMERFKEMREKYFDPTYTSTEPTKNAEITPVEKKVKNTKDLLEKINTYYSPKIEINTLPNSPLKVNKTQASSRNNISGILNQPISTGINAYSSGHSTNESNKIKRSTCNNPIRLKEDTHNLSKNYANYIAITEPTQYKIDRISPIKYNSPVVKKNKYSASSFSLRNSININNNKDGFKLNLKQVKDNNFNETNHGFNKSNRKLNNNQLNKKTSVNFHIFNEIIETSSPVKLNELNEKEELFLEKLNLSKNYFDKFTFSKINLDNKFKLVNEKIKSYKKSETINVSVSRATSNPNKSKQKKININVSNTNQQEMVLPQITKNQRNNSKIQINTNKPIK